MMRLVQSYWPLASFLIFMTTLVAHGQPAHGQPATDTGTPTMVGTWEWELDVGPKGSKASMVVESVDGKLKATVTAPDGIVLDAQEFEVQRERVAFRISRDMGLMQVVMTYKGKLDGDEISGTFDMKGGPMRKSGKWQAKRVKSK